MLHLHHLSKDFSGNPIFSNISWHLKKGERVGLVGENGAGKSTLMRIIAGQMEAGSGSIQVARGAVMGYLAQDAAIETESLLFVEVMSAFADLRAIEEELICLAASMQEVDNTTGDQDELLLRYGRLQDEFRAKGGYAMEAEAGSVLAGLGFNATDWQKPCGEFSGGWRMRIALAKLLLQKPHVLLLDEPTNHLDIEARNWLEQYLIGYPYSVILVSHDRFFMDQVCHRISEIWNLTLTDYHCNYSRYLSEREERISRLREAKKRQDEEIEKTEDFISRFRYKADKASLVQSRIRQLEKIERIVLPPERKRIRFSFPPASRSGRIVLELKGLTKAYGAHVILDSVDVTVQRGERIAIVGSNGAGKSTLMQMFAGAEYQKGERIVGANVIMDYFAQDQSSYLDETKTVYEELLADAPFAFVPRLRDLLGAFLFSGDDIHKRVGVLSGGEKNRLALAKMLLRPANLLLLDEPTNHLDLLSKEVLLDALKAYTGTMIFVSHDRHFVDSLATRVIEIKNGRACSYLGNYEDYLQKSSGSGLGAHGDGAPAPRSQSVYETDVAVPSKAERMRRREDEKLKQREKRALLRKVEELEVLIEDHETKLKQLEQSMSDQDFYKCGEAVRTASQEYDALTGRIAELYQEWETVQLAVSE